MARVLFIQDIVYEYFGVMYISAYLKKHGHECDVLIEYADKNLNKKVVDYQPDIIAFSVLTGSFNWALEKADTLKRLTNKPIVFGGVHVFLNPDKTIQHPCIDAICTGEGETAMLELCNSIDNGAIDTSINGFWFRMRDGSVKKNAPAKLVEDLDLLPFADRSIYWKYPAIANRSMFPILGSRGCPYTCTYCFIPSAKKLFSGLGKFIRERSPENILAEVRECLEKSPSKQSVHFVEDHFGNNREVALQVLEGISAMKNGQLQWAGAIRVERFNNENYVRKLSKTNHGVLGIAVECGDEDYRKNVLKRDVKNQEIIDVAALANKYGIRFVTLNMIGLPGETFEQALASLDLNIKIKPLFANCYVYQPYPGTELQKYSVEHKLLDESVIEQLGVSFYDRYWKNNERLNRLVNVQRIFALVVKFPVLRNPLVFLAKHDFRVLVDIIFGIYYTWYLAYFYKITPSQIFSLVWLWVKNKLSPKYDPSIASVQQGEGQLYPKVTVKEAS